jgi:hypothetical protein
MRLLISVSPSGGINNRLRLGLQNSYSEVILSRLKRLRITIMKKNFRIGLLASILILAGCAASPSKVPVSVPATEGDDTIFVPNSFADIPIAANDAVDLENSLLLNTGANWIGRAVLKSVQDVDTAFAYYQSNMATLGWVSVTSVQSKVSVLTFEKGARVATVQIKESGRRASYITVTVSPRDVAY